MIGNGLWMQMLIRKKRGKDSTIANMPFKGIPSMS
jgi:hypothetical protein